MLNCRRALGRLVGFRDSEPKTFSLRCCQVAHKACSEESGLGEPKLHSFDPARFFEGVPRKNPPDATSGPLVSEGEGNCCFTRCFVISLRASDGSCQVTKGRVKWNHGWRNGSKRLKTVPYPHGGCG